jgi:hypothetical protein
MAGRGLKLTSLKVSNLKQELEERDLEISGNKAILQERLRVALIEEGLDPDTFLFETPHGELNSTLERKLEENKSYLESKLVENRDIYEEKLQENNNILRNEIKDMEDKFEKNHNILRNEIKDMEGKFKEKIKKLQEHISDIERPISMVDVASVSQVGEDTSVSYQKSPVIMPIHQSGLPTFDGKMPWEDYRSLLETAAVIHGWTPEVKAAMLSLSLRGDALAILQTIPMADRQNFDVLLRRMEMRFGHQHMDQLYRSQLKNRIQKPNESLQEFESDIAHLVRKAYPSVDDGVYETLAIERFLDGLWEPETQQAIKLARPQTLSEALTQALEFEAVQQSVKGHARVRAAEAEDRSDESLEELVKKVIEKLKTGRREIRCWRCGERGHLRNKCPNKSTTNQEN